ncbi:MAG: SEC-C metal-binding domain-containing protein, partial [Gemmatimonadota bacterium]|nr:SEC-C metal-binding domain-containing protein [Gemmatimonadota bacterium]
WIVGNEQANWEMRCVAGGVLLEHTPQRHRSLLEGLGRRQAERPYPFFDHEDVANAYDAPRTDVRSQWADPWGNFYSPSAISERQERWAREAREARAREPVRAPIAVGRNDPCPCGSGKKYKRCCLQ